MEQRGRCLKIVVVERSKQALDKLAHVITPQLGGLLLGFNMQARWTAPPPETGRPASSIYAAAVARFQTTQVGRNRSGPTGVRTDKVQTPIGPGGSDLTSPR
jgi:hypothetical protein